MRREVMPLMYVIDAATALLLGVVASWLLTEIYVQIYAWRLGVPLSELSEAYGMGMLGMLIQLVSLIGVSALAFYALARRRYIRSRVNP